MTEATIFDRFWLKDKVIVVTGGAGLIGTQLSHAVLSAKGTLICADLNFKNKDKLETEFSKYGGNVEFLTLDITSRDSIRNLIQTVMDKYGKIDSWNNLAYPRTAEFGADFEKITDNSWNTNIDMHLGGYFKCSQEILETMKQQKFGNLVNYGSIYGVLGPNFNIYKGTEMGNAAEYAAIKGGIINLTRYLATYYGKHNIRVNAICPGGVFDNQNEIFVKNYNELTPLGRMARADEIAAANLFLISDAASYVSGHVMMVDGGWSTW